MMWTELRSLDEAPAIESWSKGSLANDSEYIWLVSRDDGTPVLLAGLYHPVKTLDLRLVWIYPYATIAPFDWRGLKKLFVKLTEKMKNLGAEIDMTNIRAVRVVEHLGFTKLHQEKNTGVYQWTR